MSETNSRPKESGDFDIWFRAQVEEGLKSAREGRLIANEEVEAMFASRREALLRILNEQNDWNFDAGSTA